MKKEKNKKINEEPSRKKGRQARLSRSNAIMDRVNTQREREQEKNLQYTHAHLYINQPKAYIKLLSYSIHFPFSFCTVIVMFMLIVAIIEHSQNWKNRSSVSIEEKRTFSIEVTQETKASFLRSSSN